MISFTGLRTVPNLFSPAVKNQFDFLLTERELLFPIIFLKTTLHQTEGRQAPVHSTTQKISEIGPPYPIDVWKIEQNRDTFGTTTLKPVSGVCNIHIGVEYGIYGWYKLIPSR